MFSCQANENLPVSAETQLWLTSNEKTNRPTLKFLWQHRTNMNPLLLKNSIDQRLKKKLRNVSLKISIAALQRPMSAIVFSIQSLNNIWMMSNRKCSIGVIR